MRFIQESHFAQGIIWNRFWTELNSWAICPTNGTLVELPDVNVLQIGSTSLNTGRSLTIYNGGILLWVTQVFISKQ